MTGANPRKGERPASIEFGMRIRARRSEIGMTQERLADLLGRSHQQMCKYERGVNRFPATLLGTLCEILDVSADHFVDRKSPLPEGYDASNKGVLALVRNYRLLPYEHREMVSDLVAKLVRGVVPP